MTQVVSANLDRRAVIENATTKDMWNKGRYSKRARFDRAVSVLATSDVYFSVGNRLCEIDNERACRVLATLFKSRLTAAEHKVYFALLSHVIRNKVKEAKLLKHQAKKISPRIVLDGPRWVAAVKIAKEYGCNA